MRTKQRFIPQFAVHICIGIVGCAIGPLAASAACVDTNTCFGTSALAANTTGTWNSAFGYHALASNKLGSANSAFGFEALPSSDGAWNTAVGFQALFANQSNSDNTATGAYALWQTFAGGNNTANGSRSLLRNRTGERNTAVGSHSMEENDYGSNNTAVGADSLRSNTGSLYNSALGFAALANAAGGGNTGIGAEALAGYTEIRDAATYGTLNTAVGWLSMSSNVDGSNNTASGYNSLAENVSGNGNAAFGVNALAANITGSHNTASGTGALGQVDRGARNVAVGYQAGRNLKVGSDNIILGAGNLGRFNDSGTIRIGSASQKKTFIAGIRGITTGLASATPVFIDENGQLGTIKSSRAVKEDIQPIGEMSERIYRLRPVTFRYKQAFDDGSKPAQFGLIAEEVAEAFPELVVYDENGKPETVSYHLLSTLLVNELQKQRQVGESQANRIAELERKVAELAARQAAGL